MASLIPETETPVAENVAFAATDSAKRVEQRLHNRSRRLVTNVGPLGWLFVDVSVAFFAAMVAFSLTPNISADPRHATAGLFALVFAICVSVCSHIFGFHDRRHVNDSSVSVWRVGAVVSIALALSVLELLTVQFMFVGRYVLAITLIVSVVGMCALRIIVQHFSENFAQAVCFVGGPEFRQRAEKFVAERRQSFLIRQLPEGVADLAGWAVDEEIDQLVLDPSRVVTDGEEQLLRCLDEGINVQTYPDFLESNYLVVPVQHINASWLFNARLDLAHPYYHGLKRVFDVVAAVTGLILTAPVVTLAILAIKIESRGGPAFYSQIRSGRFTRPFRIYKLRTMIEGAEKDGAKWASAADSRITTIGKILRKTRIDEIPQFWNVLKGEMSLVGPRPERPEFVELLRREIPFYVQRHLVKPGLTGWAQINYPYGASVEDARNKLTYDLYYVKHSSLTLDFQILLRTVGTIMKGSR